MIDYPEHFVEASSMWQLPESMIVDTKPLYKLTHKLLSQEDKLSAQEIVDAALLDPEASKGGPEYTAWIVLQLEQVYAQHGPCDLDTLVSHYSRHLDRLGTLQFAGDTARTYARAAKLASPKIN